MLSRIQTQENDEKVKQEKRQRGHRQQILQEFVLVERVSPSTNTANNVT